MSQHDEDPVFKLVSSLADDVLNADISELEQELDAEVGGRERLERFKNTIRGLPWQELADKADGEPIHLTNARVEFIVDGKVIQEGEVTDATITFEKESRS
ncbi:hypothetical protein [Pelagibacterium luteolum]|uniref:Uncharacterized protein n=1 Tax=Pelagibacterium luteolum TaxID=440168 RepID=A0A1G7XI96_9HYPH|nr:hypothetical protein [Pelagibacterium luteolum]SDG83833.1 hypothetical protein SAMN04487974_109130 [Pelagibacterium luteolum]